MVASVENHNSKLDAVLWGAVTLLIAVSIAGQYYFGSGSLPLRIGAMVVAVGVALGLASRTTMGRNFLVFWQESLVELRKVVWPTRKETLQSTLAVVVMVFVMGLVLWSIDAVLVRIMAWMIKGAM